VQCRLCQNDATLQNSHIIPEFFYNPLYDEKHRFLLLTTSTEERNMYLQKGIREKLLCRDCEQFFGQLENYGRHFFYAVPEKDHFELKYEDKEGRVVVSNIDYAKFRLFQLSLLWRVGVSGLDVFADVDLGSHESQIRSMLCNKEPGSPEDYPCLLTGVLKEKGQPLVDLVIPPSKVYVQNHRCYRLLLGGCLWLFVVSSHLKKLPSETWSVTRDGRLEIFLMNASDLPLITTMAGKLLSARLSSGGRAS